MVNAKEYCLPPKISVGHSFINVIYNGADLFIVDYLFIHNLEWNILQGCTFIHRLQWDILLQIHTFVILHLDIYLKFTVRHSFMIYSMTFLRFTMRHLFS